MELLTMVLPAVVVCDPQPAATAKRAEGTDDRITTKLLRVMKLTAVILIAFCLHVSAKGIAQKVTLFVKNATLESVFKAIKQQTNVTFIAKAELLDRSNRVTLKLNEVLLTEALDACFKNQPFRYSIEGRIITVEPKTASPAIAVSADWPLTAVMRIMGYVLNADGAPLPGAAIAVKHSKNTATTGTDGGFTLNAIEGDVLLISFVGYASKEVTIRRSQSVLTIVLEPSLNKLDEVQIIAYGTTSKRYSTSAVSKITSEEIAKQPVSNPLAALQGRAPGLNITSTNGVPGSAIQVQIRGANSLTNGSEPLFIVDGVPFAPGNGNINQMISAASRANPQDQLTISSSGPISSTSFVSSGLSPFTSINPADIESVEILKDADATAIYGSRGANGVILITTKKGKAGKTTFNGNVYTGISKVTRMPDMLNTQQYLEMRREAFKNDGVTPTATTAYDLLLWDNTRYTNWPELLMGGTAHTTDASTSVSGGSLSTQFLIGAGYHNETSIFPTDNGYSRGSFNATINHTSDNRKFFINLLTNYSTDLNNLANERPSTNLPPNAPALYDANGFLYWGPTGATYTNPMAQFLNTNETKKDNLLANLLVGYKLFPGFTLKSSFGYNNMIVNEMKLLPRAAKDPGSTTKASSSFANSNLKSLIIEPQAEYIKTINKSRLTVLAGASWQQNNSYSNAINASGYTNDALLKSLGAAATITSNNSFGKYRYAALFGRINYNLNEKYILNLSGRRDGSSRFGPGRRYNNFGAIGAAWLFASELFIKKQFPFMSFGKLRSSYGITGSDQIGDYKYLDTWATSSSNNYQGSMGLVPDALFNPDYNWERNRKLEVALDLGFWNDRLLATVAFFRNRSSNQLVAYKMPSQTGFSNMLRNFPALIQNTGWEIELSGDVIKSKQFNWNASINLTIPRNKLVNFPDIENSSYAYFYEVGQSIHVVKGYNSLGVNPATGVFAMEDKSGNGTIGTTDRIIIGDLDPRYYGGLRNTFSWKGLELDVFLEYKRQLGTNYLYALYGSSAPGNLQNQPTFVMSRWQKPGDIATIQQFTTTTTTAAYGIIGSTRISNIVYSNASYVRVKNLALSYRLPKNWLSGIKMKQCRVYLQAQNLFTFYKVKGIDPEVAVFSNSVPMLRTLTAGFQVGL